MSYEIRDCQNGNATRLTNPVRREPPPLSRKNGIARSSLVHIQLLTVRDILEMPQEETHEIEICICWTCCTLSSCCCRNSVGDARGNTECSRRLRRRHH